MERSHGSEAIELKRLNPPDLETGGDGGETVAEGGTAVTARADSDEGGGDTARDEGSGDVKKGEADTESVENVPVTGDGVRCWILVLLERDLHFMI